MGIIICAAEVSMRDLRIINTGLYYVLCIMCYVHILGVAWKILIV